MNFVFPDLGIWWDLDEHCIGKTYKFMVHYVPKEESYDPMTAELMLDGNLMRIRDAEQEEKVDE